MKTVVILCLVFSGLLFGQNNSLPAAPPIPQVVSVAKATICYSPSDRKANFPNGTESFIKKVENLITLASVKIKKNEKILTAILNFTVEKDGNIIEFQMFGSNASFNDSVEKATKHIHGKWIPAIQDGNLVRSKIQVPISLHLK